MIPNSMQLLLFIYTEYNLLDTIIWWQLIWHQKLSIHIPHLLIFFSVDITNNLLSLRPHLMLVFWCHCYFTTTSVILSVVGRKIICELNETENRMLLKTRKKVKKRAIKQTTKETQNQRTFVFCNLFYIYFT